MQIGFYFDQTRCTGCGACQVACKDWHDIPAGPEKWISITCTERGTCPDVFVSYMIAPCWHCEDPVCVAACPADAVWKRREDGIVLVDSDKCLGNEACDVKCLKACPYDAPQFDATPGAKMRKCTLCADRWETGDLPVCVEACPTRALDAGPIGELRARYGDATSADNFTYSKRVKPSVVFKKKEK
ncbi:MAG: 4Fe-4S dicluster domain-containing protein [Desulfobacterales bacterium]